VRNVYSGHSGRAGYEALNLRDAGFTGEANAVASIMGNIYGSDFDSGMATAELGRTWWILRNYFKRFATGRYAHGALDLIEDFSQRLGPRLEAAAIDRIDVATFFWAATLAGQTVRTPFGLRFSLPMAIARRIVHGPVALTDDGERAFGDPAVAALAQRIFVVEDKAASSAYPDRQPTRVRITFKDGDSESAGSERIVGECDHPLPVAVLQAKFVELTKGVWGGGAARAWVELSRIEEVADVRALIAGWREHIRAHGRAEE
jgi:2-methylcitrate dehydratase PrpD